MLKTKDTNIKDKILNKEKSIGKRLPCVSPDTPDIIPLTDNTQGPRDSCGNGKSSLRYRYKSVCVCVCV